MRLKLNLHMTGGYCIGAAKVTRRAWWISAKLNLDSSIVANCTHHETRKLLNDLGAAGISPYL